MHLRNIWEPCSKGAWRFSYVGFLGFHGSNGFLLRFPRNLWEKNNKSDETIWRLYAINYHERRMDDVYFFVALFVDYLNLASEHGLSGDRNTSLRRKEQQSLQRGRWRSTRIPFMCYDCMCGQDMKESCERQSWGGFPSLQSLLAIVLHLAIQMTLKQHGSVAHI